MADFIAEISSNHNGDQQRCFELIRAAARCGCSGVKFQLFRINHLFAPEVLQVSERHRERRRWELPIHFLKDLATCCHDEGVLFGCTPFDLEAVDLLEPHTDFLKIASYELPWTGLIRHCATTGQPLMLSTGMANAQECRAGADAAVESGCSDLTVFHCVSSYPVAGSNCNLAAIASLKELLIRTNCRVGWSDHSVSPEVIARAVKHWHAEVVEFHFDLDGKGDEFGGGHCWLPHDIGPVIAGKAVLAGPECDGDGELAPSPLETEERAWRADPSDGLRPTLPVRKSWSEKMDEATPAGPRVIFYPAGMGLGHVSRCLALAEALRRYHQARIMFLIHGTRAQQNFLDRHGFAWRVVSDQAGVCEAVTELSEKQGDGSPLCVLDMLDSAGGMAESLKSRGFSVAVLDQPDCESADLIVVPSFGWRSEKPTGRTVGGSQYLLVREDILHNRGDRAASCGEKRMVVSFGGRDPNRLTEKVIQALELMVEKPAVQIIVGPEFSEFDRKTEKILARNPQIQIIETGASMEVVLPGSDLVITAMGVTVAEAQVLGLPVALLANWRHDEEAARRLVAEDAVADWGHGPDITVAELGRQLQSLWTDRARRQTLADNAWRLVDGAGAGRVAALVCDLAAGQENHPC